MVQELSGTLDALQYKQEPIGHALELQESQKMVLLSSLVVLLSSLVVLLSPLVVQLSSLVFCCPP